MEPEMGKGTDEVGFLASVAGDGVVDFFVLGSGCDTGEYERWLEYEISGWETEGGAVARNTSETVPAGEFSGTGGRKGRPLDGSAQPMDSEHAALERHHAAFHTDPADATSGEPQGDAAMS